MPNQPLLTITNSSQAVKALLYPVRAQDAAFEALASRTIPSVRDEFLLSARKCEEVFRQDTKSQLDELLGRIHAYRTLQQQVEQLFEKQDQLSKALTGLSQDLPSEVAELLRPFHKSLHQTFLKKVSEGVTLCIAQTSSALSQNEKIIEESAASIITELEQTKFMTREQKMPLVALVKQADEVSVQRAIMQFAHTVFSLEMLTPEYIKTIESAWTGLHNERPILTASVQDQAEAVLAQSLEGTFAKILSKVVKASAHEDFNELHRMQRAEVYYPYVLKEIGGIPQHYPLKQIITAYRVLTEDNALMEALHPIDDALWDSFSGALFEIEAQAKEQFDSLLQSVLWAAPIGREFYEQFLFEDVKYRLQTIEDALPDIKDESAHVIALQIVQFSFAMAAPQDLTEYCTYLRQAKELIDDGMITFNDAELQNALCSPAVLQELIERLNDPQERKQKRFEKDAASLLPDVTTLLEVFNRTLNENSLKVYVFGFMASGQNPQGMTLAEIEERLPGMPHRVVKQGVSTLVKEGLVTATSSKNIFRLSSDEEKQQIHRAVLSLARPGEELQLYSEPIEEPQEIIQNLADDLEQFFEKRRKIFGLFLAPRVLIPVKNKSHDADRLDIVSQEIEELFGNDPDKNRATVMELLKKDFKNAPYVLLYSDNNRRFFDVCERTFKRYYEGTKARSLLGEVEELLERIDADGEQTTIYAWEKAFLSNMRYFLQDPSGIREKIAPIDKADKKFAKEFPYRFLMETELMAVGITRPLIFLQREVEK